MARRALWRNLFRRPPPWPERVAALWAATPLFEGVPAAALRRLAATTHRRVYAPGEVLFRAAEPAAGALLVVSGRVEIRDGADAVAELAAGDFAGETGLVLEAPRGVDAVALERVEAAFLLRLEVEAWMGREPRAGARLALNLASVLARRLLEEPAA
ncbi:cyclic nucleotide-binding domain-containing protein [Inmirania thermothiophila]|uniref:Cyclic nucleotide-binding protein n=1 Tax=Inmirania thermothiophila TaxID=1750597 RepID=A0A3N1Y0E5_9GAMM|nr:cyclic nucleotide-binding domain-containing protein [Inmirania thermothiophila]ROR31991.1 cyclic nucleotide-binding protein [Inmirania thermothiophila]